MSNRFRSRLAGALRACTFFFAALLVCSLSGAERTFDFSLAKENEMPAGFKSLLAGEGKPGDWRIITTEVPPTLPPLSTQAPSVSKRAVLAQLSRDSTDEHFPMLVYEGETFTDFTFTTRFKTVSGTVEQMAGVVFRLVDEKNFYVLRASSLGNNVRFYKVVNGQRGTLIGPSVNIPTNTWHDLAVQCAGNQIRCLLDGREIVPPLTDNSFSRGKIGFWTKSDSVSYFSDSKITYVPSEMPARAIARSVLKANSRLLGLKIYVAGTEPDSTLVIAAHDETMVGQPGEKAESEVLKTGAIYYGKTTSPEKAVLVTMPVRDRNGEVIAAVKLIMRTFAGQTERNAVERAAPILKSIQSRVQSMEDLVLK